eukprot:scaffold1982_cov358-Pavlova_lutheri.AAC.14
MEQESRGKEGVHVQTHIDKGVDHLGPSSRRSTKHKQDVENDGVQSRPWMGPQGARDRTSLVDEAKDERGVMDVHRPR